MAVIERNRRWKILHQKLSGLSIEGFGHLNLLNALGRMRVEGNSIRLRILKVGLAVMSAAVALVEGNSIRLRRVGSS